jgi:hypothetical protein
MGMGNTGQTVYMTDFGLSSGIQPLHYENPPLDSVAQPILHGTEVFASIRGHLGLRE